MISFTKNTVNSLLLLGLMASTVPSYASQTGQINVQTAVEKAVVQQKTSLQKYREQLQALTPADNQTAPTQEDLLPILRELATYNAQLSYFADWNEQSYLLAQEMNKPVSVYWNRYRGNSLVEILDTYIHDNHGDVEISKLEFLVKKNLISYKNWLENKALYDILPYDFVAVQAQMEISLANMTTRDATGILRNMVSFAGEYNKLYQQDKTRHIALQLHEVYFRQPIRTGWNKTVTVKELRSRYGMRTYDEAFSAEELASLYDLTEQEAETLHAFFAHYYK